MKEFMQENTHAHLCLVAEDPAGVCQACSTGVCASDVQGRKHLHLALVLRCPICPRCRGQMSRTNNVEVFVAAAAAVI